MEYVKQIAFFMVFSGILLELISGTKYQKFGEWVVGILLIMQIVMPFINKEQIWDKFLYRLASFDYVMQGESVLEEIVLGEEQVTESVRITYEETLRKQIAAILERNSLVLQKAAFEISETSGELLKLSVWAGYQTQTQEKQKEEKILISAIPPIVIGTKEEETEQPKVMTPLEIYIKNLLSDFYNLEANNINISIQEESC